MTKSPAGVRTKIQRENLEKGYRLEDKSTGCHGAGECPASVHFLSDQGCHSLGQTTGFIFKQRLPPFLSSGEIRYSKHVSLAHSQSNSVTHHKTGTATQLLHCTNDLYAQTQADILSLSPCVGPGRAPHGGQHAGSSVKTEGIRMQNQLTNQSADG